MRSRGIAHDRNPLSPEPLWELSYIEQSRGRLANAQGRTRGGGPDPARQRGDGRAGSGRFQLSVLNQPADALASFRAAYFLDPRNPASELRLPRGQPGERPARAALPPASP